MDLTVSGETIESLLYLENRPVLELKISYPQIMGPLSKRCEERFNTHYCRMGRQLNRQARTEFYHRASEDCRSAKEQGYGFSMHSFLRTFSVARMEDRYTSLLFDRYQYVGGTHGMTMRTARVWDLLQGRQICLRELFQKGAPYRTVIRKKLASEIDRQNKNEEILFFKNPLKNAIECFREEKCYLTETAVGVFYPLYTLAPYSAGILTYKIPFSDFDGYWRRDRRPLETTPFTGGFSSSFGTEYL